MPYDRLFYPLWLNADIMLCDGNAAVLQEPLYYGNIIAVVFVNLCRIPLPERMCADALIAEIITDNGKLLLYRPGG